MGSGTETAIVVMAKVPRPGGVKTRLARVLGPDPACALYRAFIGDLDQRLSGLGYPVLWFHWPDDPGFRTLLSGSAPVRAQRGENLGERMETAFTEAFDQGFGPVVMLGADVPHVPLAYVVDAAERLVGRDEVVLGPAADGGYYLIGLRSVTPRLFRGIGWGTDTVFEATMRRIGEEGLRVGTLPPWFDLDEIRDLERLVQLLAGDSAELPRTRAVLLEHGLLPWKA